MTQHTRFAHHCRLWEQLLGLQLQSAVLRLCRNCAEWRCSTTPHSFPPCDSTRVRIPASGHQKTALAGVSTEMREAVMSPWMCTSKFPD